MRNISKSIIAAAILVASIAISCNRYTTPNSPESIEDRRITKESKYNLMGFPGDREIITSDVAAADTLRESSDVISFPEYKSDNEEQREIFAVQVFASKSSEEAGDFAKSLAPIFAEKISTDYKPPYYKVRIGSCANLEQAEDLLQKVKVMGFPNAWLVRIMTQ